MAIDSTNPIVVDGNTYPHYLVNLAISPYKAPHGASVALRLTPYRFLEDKTIEQLPEHAKAVSLLDVFQVAENDPAFEKAVAGIMDTLQEFINDKGL
jgi:hypothetical protein